MKKFLYILLLMGIILPVSVFAQDTVWVANDGNQGTLNTAIDNVQADSVNGVPTKTNTVFMLYRGGYYVLNGTITLAKGTHYTIAGEPAPLVGPDPGPPIVIPGTILGGYYNYQIDCYGDLTMKNVWWIYAYQSGAQDWTSIQFEENGQPTAHGTFENCIFDYARAIAVTSNRSGFIGTWKNCIFRNDIDPTQWWAGRMFATVSNTVTTDSIYADNCTFENMGFAFQTDYIPPKSVWFNHCTFLNIAKFTFKFYYMSNLICTNCVFVNNHFTGERYSDRLGQDPDLLLYGAVLDIDTVNVQNGLPAPDYNNVSEQNRVVLFYNNSNYTDPAFQTFYDSYNDTVSSLKGMILAEPMMNSRTLDMFSWHPYMKMGNVYDSTDPGFVKPATNMDSIMAFLFNRYVPTSKGGGGNVFWGYYPDSTLLGSWPLPENLAYTNPKLLSAGMSGYPLGDLYHWFPDKYTSWKAQESQENAKISGMVTGVVKNPVTQPARFELAQNYPNPFNPTTVINYSLSNSGFVALKVYNVLGQKVATLFSGEQKAGNHSITFDASKLTSGVYFYRLETSDNKIITKKMVLMK